jgi:hypothetical protein
MALEEAAGEFSDLDKSIKARLPKKPGEYLVGDFVLVRGPRLRSAPTT